MIAWQRLGNLARAVYLLRRRLDSVLGWTAQRLAVAQEQRWRAVAGVAAERAPFYRRLYRGIDLSRTPLDALPPVDKGELMEHFDEAVTERGLRLHAIETFLGTVTANHSFLNRFQILLTSGTSGQRGIIVYSRSEWIACLAASLRSQLMMGNRPGLPRPRLASFTSTHPRHISCRLLEDTDIGLFRRLTVDPQESLAQTLPRLQQFQANILFGYPSVITPIAQAQLDGRLDLRPQRVIAGGEAVTPAFRGLVKNAWHCAVLDLYATTETGALAVETPGGQGSYLLEDMTLVEVVDALDRPVADGEPGHHLLITCLQRTAQPLIRYRLSDQLTLDRPLGAGFPPFRRVRQLEGRVRDTLRLKNRQGQEVEIRPSFLLAGLLGLAGARQVRVLQEVGKITVFLVAAPDQAAVLPAGVIRWFEALGRERELQLPQLVVELVPRLQGSDAAMGKFRPVECRLPS